MNPFDSLTEKDIATMQNYIELYIPFREQQSPKIVLNEWNKNKRTLYKAFGGNLRVSFPIEIKDTTKDKIVMLHDLYIPAVSVYHDCRNEFLNDLHKFFKGHHRYLVNLDKMIKYKTICYGYTDTENVLTSNNKKALTIPRGTKVMRAVRKFLLYYNYDNMDLFEEWRNAVSNIMTKNSHVETLTLSIHPLDFMTLSDNNCDWTTCYSWETNTYCGSTIRAMNSNMSVVAYVSSQNPFFENIPNKRWRCLLYVHKNILAVGKSYPYEKDSLRIEALNKMRQLVYKNLKWKYQYGMETYGDMHSIVEYDINFPILDYDFSKRIYISTGDMYNDIFMDKAEDYFCYRNYVKKPLHLSYAGKHTCICCGKELDNEGIEYLVCKNKCH